MLHHEASAENSELVGYVGFQFVAAFV